ncbi:MAG: multicopper oxidase domain-containing protein, partial [Acidobacteriota bacterium]
MFVPISPRRWCLRLNPVSIPSPSPRRRISGSTLWIFGLALSLLPTLLSPAVARASGTVVEAELTIEQALVDFTGTPTPGMTVNGTIPGPTLRFREGDLARIHVHNRMDVPTSVHWHGLLVPPDMDGAPLISSSPIAPGTTFIYEFPIRQSGTYWYHSHTALQEQQGVYGSIVIEPAGTRRTDADVPDRDHVVLFSDWTDTDPHQVLRQLRRGSEWFAVERGTGQSLLGAWRLGMLGDWLQRELQRMP